MYDNDSTKDGRAEMGEYTCEFPILIVRQDNII